MTLHWNGQKFTPVEFLTVSFTEEWLVDVQRVLAFLVHGEPHFEVPTSGSTGRPKRLRHSRARMDASARATLDHFQLQPGDRALLALPAKYIGGAMMVVRAYLGQLHLYLVEPKMCPALAQAFDFVPLTPAQYDALRSNSETESFLRQSHVVGIR